MSNEPSKETETEISISLEEGTRVVRAVKGTTTITGFRDESGDIHLVTYDSATEKSIHRDIRQGIMSSRWTDDEGTQWVTYRESVEFNTLMLDIMNGAGPHC